MNKDLERWGYKESGKNLNSRITTHKNFAEKDIDAWVSKLINIRGGEKILDLGCGDGKQVLAFGKQLDRSGEIVGCDISKELLKKAKVTARENKINATFLLQSMDRPFAYEDEEFDLISSFFSIYYVKNPIKVIFEIKRLLKKGGRLFIVGPTPNNAKAFWNLHSKIVNKKIPQIALSRRARIHDIFIPLIKKYFKNVKISIFKNAIHFPNSEELIKYYSSSLLFEESSRSDKKKEFFLDNMKKEVEKTIKRNGVFDIMKEVYGISAYK